MKAFEREDEASILRFGIGQGKVYGVLGNGVESRAIMSHAEQQPAFITAVTAAFGGALIPVPGGVLIVDGEPRIAGRSGRPAIPRIMPRPRRLPGALWPASTRGSAKS